MVGDILDNPHWLSTATASASAFALVEASFWHQSGTFGWTLGKRILALGILGGVIGVMVAIVRAIQARQNRKVLHLHVTDEDGITHTLQFGVAGVQDPILAVNRFLEQTLTPSSPDRYVP